MSDEAFRMASALRRLAVAVERLSPDDLTKLNDEASEIEIRIVVRRRQKEEPPAEARIDLAEVVAKLTALPSRSEAAGFLEGAVETKKGLEQIARHLDVAVLKQDKAETLRDKIIEATVGARLRSEAIKGGD
ncbi:hypothetical protein [Pelomonas sp. Root1444]|uniref:hypothetical protein n=1 Tax=Pelomonas sp. Root1444 TaxID=1736464 RepID=UPI0007034B4B|nr:hypothetical protein [Pelomonas sp. Root1444]KQY85973.1 hypothetical protein ASD35_20270 [Pelomonas sp. Root1444]